MKKAIIVLSIMLVGCVQENKFLTLEEFKKAEQYCKSNDMEIHVDPGLAFYTEPTSHGTYCTTKGNIRFQIQFKKA